MSFTRIARSPQIKSGLPAMLGPGSVTSTDTHSDDDLDRNRTYSASRDSRDVRERTLSNADRETRERTRSNAGREEGDRSFSDVDLTGESVHSQRDQSLNKDISFGPRDNGTASTKSSHLGSNYPDQSYSSYEKATWSCQEASEYQKLSFLFLVITFLGHAIAVCTPYWVVGYVENQMSLYEGVWLSCYRETASGSWKCSNFDVVRNQLHSPGWYQAAQVCALLSVILLLPALVAGTLYTYIAPLRSRIRASWVLCAFLASTAFCSFLCFIIYAAGYPKKQTFPPGEVNFHVSFALQIISFLFCLLSLGTHMWDAYPNLRLWKLCVSDSFRPSVPARSSSGTVMTHKPNSQISPKPTPISFISKMMPTALSGFRRSRAENTAQPISHERRETTVTDLPAPVSSKPSPRLSAPATTYKSYAASSDTMSGYNSEV